MFRSLRGFTLLEIMLVVAIGAIIVTLAVPSLSGLMEEQRAQRSFDAFEVLVQAAQDRAIATRSPARLLLEKDRISIEGTDEDALLEEDEAPALFIAIEKGEEYAFYFPAALVPEPAAVWTFWPTGACEPAVITYAGPDARWSATYDALTSRADYSTDVP